MLDEKKIRLMARMAVYEQNQGKEDMKISAYYKKDYTSINTLFSIIWATVGYVLLVGILVLAYFNTLFDKMTLGLMVTLAIVVAAGYFVVLIAYGIASGRHYSRKHKDARTNMKKYNHDLTRLLKMYEKENP